jgi:phosphatidylglycerol:prolipoprotein diacylglycerol transferase
MFIHPQIDPIAISIGPLKVHWYGLMYFFGFLSFIYLGKKQIVTKPWFKLNEKMLDDTFFYGALGVILGGRLGYVLFYQPVYYITHPDEIFAFWHGGMSFHGGLIGVLIGIYWATRKYKANWLHTMDFIAPLVPLGLFFGRIGNFINQELWGRPTELFWGMIFPSIDDTIRHPSQLYEAFFEGIVLFLILWIFSSKERATGQISALFLILYGFFRFCIEFTRAPDSFLGYFFFDLTMGQLLSIPMVLVGLWIFNRSKV